MKRRIHTMMAIAAASALALSACSDGGNGDGADGEGGGGGGDTIRIGTKYDQPGLGLKDGEGAVQLTRDGVGTGSAGCLAQGPIGPGGDGVRRGELGHGASLVRVEAPMVICLSS